MVQKDEDRELTTGELIKERAYDFTYHNGERRFFDRLLGKGTGGKGYGTRVRAMLPEIVSL